MLDLLENLKAEFSPRSLVLSLGNNCTAACNGCAFGCHPWVEGGIEANDAISIINNATVLLPTIELVVLTGGEPLLRKDDVLQLIRHAHSLGLNTRIVTNAYWATSPSIAMSVVGELSKAGLDEINFSTGDEHIKFVPMENVLIATHAALSHDMTVAIMIEAHMDAELTPTHVLEGLDNDPLYRDNREKVLITHSPWIHVEHIDWIPSGPRAPEEARINARNYHRYGGCQSIFRDIAVQPTKTAYVCCGLTVLKIPEMSLGKVEEINIAHAVHREAEDLLKVWIAIDGPAYIMDWASSKDPSIDWEDQFSHTCEVCYWLYNDKRIRDVIKQNGQEIATRVLLRLANLNTNSANANERVSAGEE